MNYKERGNDTEFLDFQEDILKECVNSDFIHFDFENPEIQKHFNEICDFIKDVYLPSRVFNLSVEIPIYFILKKNNKNYYYKGTPERIRYIINCLSRHNFTHTQCVFHIIRLRLIIFHTPKYFHGRNMIE